VIGFYFWTAFSTDPRLQFGGVRCDYYNRLVNGFLSGHLYMSGDPHPDLFSPDPEVRARAPHLLDASLYKGHYYLYFGITPALLAFLPWRILSGGGLPEPYAAALFGSAGFLLGTALLARLRQRHLFSAGIVTWAILLLSLGFCSIVPVALRHGMFYEVAACSAFFSAMLLFYAAFRAFELPARAGFWLAVSGIAYALAVGSRANLAPSGLFLPLLAWLVWLQLPREERTGRRFWRCLLAAGLPAAAGIGCLFLYNFQRFGNIFEFGHSYQVDSNPSGFPFSFSFLWHNLQIYYFSLPEISCYFPFFAPANEAPRPAGYWGIEHVHTQFFILLLWAPLLAGAVIFLRRRFTAQPLLFLLALLLAWSLENAVIIALTGVRADRYLIDFQPAFILASGLGILALSGRSSPALRLLRAASLAVLVFGCFYNAMASFQLQEFFKSANRPAYERLARIFDYPSWWWQGYAGDKLGPLRLSITFPESPAATYEPIVTTGTSWFSDTLYVHYLGPDSVRIVLDHQGHGGPSSGTISVRPGRPYTMVVYLGSLYPPEGHPYFDNLVMAQVRELKHLLRVDLDGATVLETSAAFYDASPRQLYVGSNPLWPSLVRGRFSGKIAVEGRESVDLEQLGNQARTESGPVAMEVTFPRNCPGVAEPLVVAGENGHADTFLVRYVNGSHLKFALDHWGGGIVESPLLTVDYSRPHELEVHMGALYPPGVPVAPALRRLLLVKLDGRVVWARYAEFHVVDARSIDTGTNHVGASTCQMFFSGSLIKVRRLAPPRRSDQANGSQLPQLLSLCMPADCRGQSEILFEGRDTGMNPFRAEIRYRDRASVQLCLVAAGRTRWTDPLPADDGRIHELVVGKSFAPSKKQPSTDGLTSYLQDRWQRGIRLYFDGRLVLDDDSVQPSNLTDHWRWMGGGADANSVDRAEPSGLLDHGSALGWMATTPLGWTTAGGSLRLELKLPRDRPGGRDPLLVTGQTGKGDALFIEYADDRHIRVGFDHWGAGGPSSPSVAVDYGEPVSISADWRPEQGTLAVEVNGRRIWETRVEYYQADGEVAVGSNPLGFSTCAPVFGGEILSARFLSGDDSP